MVLEKGGGDNTSPTYVLMTPTQRGTASVGRCEEIARQRAGQAVPPALRDFFPTSRRAASHHVVAIIFCHQFVARLPRRPTNFAHLDPYNCLLHSLLRRRNRRAKRTQSHFRTPRRPMRATTVREWFPGKEQDWPVTVPAPAFPVARAKIRRPCDCPSIRWFRRSSSICARPRCERPRAAVAKQSNSDARMREAGKPKSPAAPAWSSPPPAAQRAPASETAADLR